MHLRDIAAEDLLLQGFNVVVRQSPVSIVIQLQKDAINSFFKVEREFFGTLVHQRREGVGNYIMGRVQRFFDRDVLFNGAFDPQFDLFVIFKEKTKHSFDFRLYVFITVFVYQIKFISNENDGSLGIIGGNHREPNLRERWNRF